MNSGYWEVICRLVWNGLW